jgi:membrane protease YdiL (CAAX protease family)
VVICNHDVASIEIGIAMQSGLNQLFTPITPIVLRVIGQVSRLPWIALLWVTFAELLIVIRPGSGLALHALLLVGLFIYAAYGSNVLVGRLALALSLVPLTRLLSLALPLLHFPRITWYAIISALLLIAAAIIIRQLELSRSALGLRAGNVAAQLQFSGAGIGLGAVEYFILRPEPILSSFSWNSIILPAVILVIFTGFSEELIFRGLLQAVTMPVLGRWTLLYGALLFAVMHIGYGSLVDIAFVFAVGMMFGLLVHWGRSILGVSLAHGLTNVTLILIAPFLATHPEDNVAIIIPWLILGGSILAVLAVVMLRPTGTPGGSRPEPELPAHRRTRNLRQAARLTYVELAQRTGLPARVIAEIEHGWRHPDPDHLRLITEAIDEVR